MTLDEAIQHAKFQAAALGCNECGKEHEQLSKWLEELKEYPGKQFAALCIRECHINKDKLDIYHKAFSEVKEKHPEYEWIL